MTGGGGGTPDVSEGPPSVRGDWSRHKRLILLGIKNVCESNGPNATRLERFSWRRRPTSDSFVQVPLGFLLVTGTQRLAVGSVEEAVVVERRLPVPETLHCQ